MRNRSNRFALGIRAMNALTEAITKLTLTFGSLSGLATHKDLEEVKEIMGNISDAFVAVRRQLDTVNKDLDAIKLGITNLQELVLRFENSPGALSPADQANWDPIVSAMSSLVDKAEAMVPLTVPPTPPEPVVTANPVAAVDPTSGVAYPTPQVSNVNQGNGLDNQGNQVNPVSGQVTPSVRSR